MIVTAHLYSGRPNPTWPLDAAGGAELTRRLTSLSAVPARQAPPPRLGYRGLGVTLPGDVLEGCTSVRVMHGRVRAECPDGPRELLDDDRALERWLLDRACSSLPDHVVSSIARAAGL